MHSGAQRRYTIALVSVRAWLCVSVVVAAAACSQPAQREGAPPQAVAADRASRNVLARFPAGDEFAFEVSLLRCRETRNCPIVVSLLNGSTVIDSAELGWPSAAETMTKAEPDVLAGAGDSLFAAAEAQVFQSGENALYVTVAPRPVTLADGRSGVLVSERAGAEHSKRRHDLFVRDGSKLLKAWSAEEGSGETWSSTHVIPGNQGGPDRILYYTALRSGESSPDSLGVTLVHWDESAKTAKPATNVWPPDVSVVQLRTARSIQDARSARDTLVQCFETLWVLEASKYHLQDAAGFFLGGLTSNPGAAALVQDEAASCEPGLKPAVVPYLER